MPNALIGKVGKDIKYAAAGTIAVWIIFYYLFPTQPLNVSDTLVVLLVFVLVVKASRSLFKRLRRDRDEGNT